MATNRSTTTTTKGNAAQLCRHPSYKLLQFTQPELFTQNVVPSRQNGNGADNASKGNKNKMRSIVDHSYTDYANYKIRPLLRPKLTNPSSRTYFPMKLYDMIEHAHNSKVVIRSEAGSIPLSHVLRWKPHGRVFVIDPEHKKELEDYLLCQYFSSKCFISFQRQLNCYGFKHLMGGSDTLAYYHECFLRTKPELTVKIKRHYRKKNGYKPISYPKDEPNFNELPWLPLFPSKPIENKTMCLKSSLQENTMKRKIDYMYNSKNYMSKQKTKIYSNTGNEKSLNGSLIVAGLNLEQVKPKSNTIFQEIEPVTVLDQPDSTIADAENQMKNSRIVVISTDYIVSNYSKAMVQLSRNAIKVQEKERSLISDENAVSPNTCSSLNFGEDVKTRGSPRKEPAYDSTDERSDQEVGKPQAYSSGIKNRCLPFSSNRVIQKVEGYVIDQHLPQIESEVVKAIEYHSEMQRRLHIQYDLIQSKNQNQLARRCSAVNQSSHGMLQQHVQIPQEHVAERTHSRVQIHSTRRSQNKQLSTRISPTIHQQQGRVLYNTPVPNTPDLRNLQQASSYGSSQRNRFL